MSFCSTPGSGRTNTAASFSSNSVSSARPAIGTVRASRWSQLCTIRSSTRSSTSTTKAKSTGASAWSTGTRRAAPPFRTRRLSPRKFSRSWCTSTTPLPAQKASTSPLQPCGRRRSWPMPPSLLIRTTSGISTYTARRQSSRLSIGRYRLSRTST